MMSDEHPVRPAASVSSTVIATVAAHEGVDPIDLPERLYDVIDPDALENLFTGEEGTATFLYCGYEVSVHADGRVTLTERTATR